MWVWFFGGYAVFVAVLIGYGTHISLSCTDERRRADAYKVLKLRWTAITGAGGLVLAALKLHDAGLL